MDTRMMFQSLVHSIILDVVDKITAQKGIKLSELERQITR
jgi:hypothetical protein